MPPNKEQHAKLEVPSQLGENRVGDMVADFSKYTKHPSIFDDGHALAEAYAENRCEIHVHFRIGYTGGAVVSGYYCAVFNRTRRQPLDVVRSDNSAEDGGMVDGPNQSELHEMGQTMLVGVRKFVQPPQGIGSVILPSRVRLQSVDVCLRSWVDAPDFVLAFPRVHRLSTENGELGVSDELVRRRVPVAGDNEFVNEVVKSRTEVVQAVSEDKREPSGRSFRLPNPEDILALLRIEFVNGSIRTRFLPPVDFGFETLQVLPRPIQPE